MGARAGGADAAPEDSARRFLMASMAAFWPKKLLFSCDDVLPVVVTITLDKTRLPLLSR